MPSSSRRLALTPTEKQRRSLLVTNMPISLSHTSNLAFQLSHDTRSSHFDSIRFSLSQINLLYD